MSGTMWGRQLLHRTWLRKHPERACNSHCHKTEAASPHCWRKLAKWQHRTAFLARKKSGEQGQPEESSSSFTDSSPSESSEAEEEDCVAPATPEEADEAAAKQETVVWLVTLTTNLVHYAVERTTDANAIEHRGTRWGPACNTSVLNPKHKFFLGNAWPEGARVAVGTVASAY